MNIKPTNRILNKMYSRKENVRENIQMHMIKEYIDGAIIQNTELINLSESKELLKQYFSTEMSISPATIDRMIPALTPIYPFDFLTNVYLMNIILPQLTVGNLTIETVYYQKHEFTILDEPIQSLDLSHVFNFGVFGGPAKTYVLKQDGQVIVKLSPREVNVIAKLIKEASGNILVLGGDIAYYPYLASLKETVTGVTIVENNPHAYKIIKEYILPQFPNDKCDIFFGNAEDYLKSSAQYDTIFLNFWHDHISGSTLYKKFVSYELKQPDAKFQYYLEGSILDTYVVNISEYFNAKLGMKESQECFKKIAPDLWTYMENIHCNIERPEQLDYYLTRNFAKSFLLGINPA